MGRFHGIDAPGVSDREVVEIPDDHEVFHVVYDLDHKIQIPGSAALNAGPHL